MIDLHIIFATGQLWLSALLVSVRSCVLDSDVTAVFSQHHLATQQPLSTYLSVLILACLLQVADEMVAYKRKNPAWHGPKSVRPFYEKS